MENKKIAFGAFVFCLLIFISPAQAVTVGLDTVNGAVLEDNWLLSEDNMTSYGSSVLQGVMRYQTCPRTNRIITKYNLTSAGIPADATITNATWWVFNRVNSGDPTTVFLHVTNQTWNEEETKWLDNPCSAAQNATAGCNTTISSTAIIAGSDVWNAIDLTAIVKMAHNAGTTNVSWLGMVQSPGECGFTTIYSQWATKEMTNVTERHYLNITYLNLISVGNETYEPSVLSQVPTTFTANVTFLSPGATFHSAYLNYNGTSYANTSSVNNSNILTLSRLLTAPTVTSLSNMTFFWEVYYNDSGTIRSENTTAKNQTVYIPYVSTCSAGYVNSKRIVFLNETSPFSSVNATFEAYLELSASGSLYNYSFSGKNTTVWVCIGPTWASYDVDGQIRYTGNASGEYESRDYFLDNVTFDNVTEDLNLYQTPVATADHFAVQVQDQYSSPYANAIVQVQRWYPELGAYKIVAAPKTNAQGQASTYLTLYDVYYRFVVAYDGETIYTSTMSPMTTPTTDVYLITISPGEIMSWLKYHGKVSGACSFSNATNLLSCSYADTSADMTSVSLTVYQQGALTSSLVCSASNATAGAGTLSCDLGATTGKVMEYKLVMTLGTVQMALATGGISTGFESTMLFGNCRLAENALACKEGLIVAFFLVLIVGMVGMFHPGAAVIMAMSALTFTWYVGLVAISAQTVVGLVFVAAVLIYRMRD